MEIVENRREGGKVKQEVVGRLGRLDVVKQRGALDNLLRSASGMRKSLPSST